MRSMILAGFVLMASASGVFAADVEFRPVVDCATHPGAEHLAIYSPQAHCLSPAVVTEKDFARLERLRPGGGTFLRGKLTEAAHLRFYDFTLHHRFRPMALLVDGRPTRVWEVGGPVQSNWLAITGGYLSDREADQVADRYYAEGGRH